MTNIINNAKGFFNSFETLAQLEGYVNNKLGQEIKTNNGNYKKACFLCGNLLIKATMQYQSESIDRVNVYKVK